MLSSLRSAVAAAAGHVADAASTVVSATGAVASTATDAVATAASVTAGTLKGAVDGVVETAQDAGSKVSGAARSVLDTAEEGRDAVVEGFWYVGRPVEKVGTVAVGMASHLAPVLAGRAVSRLVPSVWLGPLAPIGTLIGVVETVRDVAEAVDRGRTLWAEASERVDAAEAARLAARARRAEERLAQLRVEPATASNGSVAVAVGETEGTDGRRGPVIEIRLLHGPHAGRSLAELPRAEVEALAADAPEEDTRRLVAAWLSLQGPVAEPEALSAPMP